MSSSFSNITLISNFRSIYLTVIEFWKRYRPQSGRERRDSFTEPGPEKGPGNYEINGNFFLFWAPNLQASRAPELSSPRLVYSICTKVNLIIGRARKHWFHGARPGSRRPWRYHQQPLNLKPLFRRSDKSSTLHHQVSPHNCHKLNQTGAFTKYLHGHLGGGGQRFTFLCKIVGFVRFCITGIENVNLLRTYFVNAPIINIIDPKPIDCYKYLLFSKILDNL